LAALLIDLDHFKHINDTLGHLAGDIAIGFVTARMQECLRTHDYVGRYGGEEFLVIIPDCEPHVARDIAERIRSRIASQPATVDAHPLTITATIGMTMSVPTDGPETILRRSDMALYAGKQRGRNTVEFAMSVDSVDYSGAGFSA
jgi:diguanylate cyclase (GGDEF)-like protein